MANETERGILDMLVRYQTTWQTADPALSDQDIDALVGFSVAIGGGYDQTVQASGLSEEQIHDLERSANKLVKRRGIR